MNVHAPSKIDDMQKQLDETCAAASEPGGPRARRVNDRYRWAGPASRLDFRHGS